MEALIATILAPIGTDVGSPHRLREKRSNSSLELSSTKETAIQNQ